MRHPGVSYTVYIKMLEVSFYLFVRVNRGTGTSYKLEIFRGFLNSLFKVITFHCTAHVQARLKDASTRVVWDEQLIY